MRGGPTSDNSGLHPLNGLCAAHFPHLSRQRGAANTGANSVPVKQNAIIFLVVSALQI